MTCSWSGQDDLVSERNRQVEENVRMLAGQQWIVFLREFNRFLDVTEFMTVDERRWRQKPVINLLLPWFMLTHSRLTENPPIVTFQPSTSDEIDRELAEVWDVIHKTRWREMGMEEVHDRLMAWIIAGGRAYLKMRVDPTRGELVPREWTEEEIAKLGTLPGTDMPPPPVQPEGDLVVDVLAAPEVRSEWGPRPFHMKGWHHQQSYLPPHVIKAMWGIDVDPTTTRRELGSDLHNLLYSSGWYGSVERPGQLVGGGDLDEALVQVDELWMAPVGSVQGMEETDESPGGRLSILLGEKTLVRDGPRPARFKYTSPLRSYDFVGIPGRPEGTSPQEMLNPIQRTYNRIWAQILEHVNLVANPKPVIHQSVALEEWSNKPAEPVVANWGVGVTNPIYYLQAQRLGDDVYKALELLERKFIELGSLHGAEVPAPSPGISGESVRELRYDADRPISATVRRAAFEYARWSDDLRAWTQVLWTAERVIEYAGEDQIMRTVTVSPHLWSGKINAFPDTESMLPEGRGARREQAMAFYAQGFFGVPDPSPAGYRARRKALDMANYPHLDRDTEPSAVHRRTCQRAMAAVAQGSPAENVPLFRWYDFMVWLEELTEFMASPEYLKMEPPIQQQMALLYELTDQASAAQMVEQAQKLQMQTALAVEAQAPAMEAQMASEMATQKPPSKSSKEPARG